MDSTLCKTRKEEHFDEKTICFVEGGEFVFSKEMDLGKMFRKHMEEGVYKCKVELFANYYQLGERNLSNFMGNLGDLIERTSRQSIIFGTPEYTTMFSTKPKRTDGVFSTNGLPQAVATLAVETAMDKIIKQINEGSAFQIGIVEREEKEKGKEKGGCVELLEVASKMLYSGAPFGVITDGNRNVPIKVKGKNGGDDSYTFQVFNPIRNRTFLLFANAIYYGEKVEVGDRIRAGVHKKVPYFCEMWDGINEKGEGGKEKVNLLVKWEERRWGRVGAFPVELSKDGQKTQIGWMKCSDLDDKEMLERIENERNILRYLESHKVDFTPKIIIDRFTCEKEGFTGIIITDCGDVLPSDPSWDDAYDKRIGLYEKLEELGVWCDDKGPRNVLTKGGKTYLIDFEGSRIVSEESAEFPPTRFLSVV